MYSKWQLAVKFLRYFLNSSNGKGHGIHSPFIYQFISKVLNDSKDYPGYERVEWLRQQLLQDNSVLSIQDHGAGSSGKTEDQRIVASIARHAAKPKKYGQLLFRMVRQYQPATILELGTSLGITTSYLSIASPASAIITIEGSATVAGRARLNFEKLGLKNIEVIEGNFDDMLPEMLHHLPAVDLVFIDGNHRQEPTEHYFSQLLSKINNDSIIIFDDIHWSRGMEQAWKNIIRNPVVRCSIDLFFMGIVFFREEFREKQDFRIRF